jgi:hypothetical protein
VPIGGQRNDLSYRRTVVGPVALLENHDYRQANSGS